MSSTSVSTTQCQYCARSFAGKEQSVRGIIKNHERYCIRNPNNSPTTSGFSGSQQVRRPTLSINPNKHLSFCTFIGAEHNTPLFVSLSSILHQLGSVSAAVIPGGAPEKTEHGRLVQSHSLRVRRLYEAVCLFVTFPPSKLGEVPPGLSLSHIRC